MSQKKLIEISLLSVFLGVYAMAACIGITAHSNLTEMDSVPYLQGALQIRQTGGIFSHIQNCFSGTYQEATQHPLYLLILSPWAERSFNFFVRAKIVSACIGFFFCLVFYWVARRMKGQVTAAVATSLLLFSATFIHLATMVACETLFALFFILFLGFTAMGVRQERYWYAAGASASLAFLSKSLGILTLAIFVISSVWIYRKNLKALVTRKSFFGFFLVFVLLATPLFARNIKVYGSPLYSDSSCVLWLDRWHDYLKPDLKEHPPTLQSYWSEHGFRGFLKILSHGLFVRDPKMIVDGLKPFPFWKNPIDTTLLSGFNQPTASWQALWAMALCAGALVAAWKKRKEAFSVVCFVAVILFLVFIGWYSKIFPNETPTRLLYPILFVILIFSADFFSFVSQKIRWFSVWIFALVFAGALAMHFDWSKASLNKSYRMNSFAAAQIVWALKNWPGDETVLLGYEAAGHVFYFPRLKSKIISWPTFSDLDQMRFFMKENKIRHAILDVATVMYNLKFFGDYFLVTSDGGLMTKRQLPELFKEIPVEANQKKFMRFYEITPNKSV